MLHLLSVLLLLAINCGAVKGFDKNPLEQKEKSSKLPPCKSCTVLVESFKLVGISIIN